MKKPIIHKILPLILLTITLLCTLPGVFAADFYVDPVNGDDSNTGTNPAEAFLTINKGVTSVTDPGDVVNLASGTYGVPGDYGITIDRSMTIAGAGKETTIIDPKSVNPAVNSKIFTVNNGVTLFLKNLTMQNGHTTGNGGAMETGYGSVVEINDSRIINNVADINAGGIFSQGTLTLNRCQVNHNNGTLNGGGLYNLYSTLTVTDSEIIDNRCYWNGAGIYNAGYLTNDVYTGSLTVTGTTINQNTAMMYYGGGIYSGASDATIVNSNINQNYAALGGGIYNENKGKLTITGTTIQGNTLGGNVPMGAGIMNYEGDMTITGSTITDHYAYYGSGIFHNVGTATITDTTISRNSALYNAGGIENGATMTINNCDMDHNTAMIGGAVLNVGYLTINNSRFNHNNATSTDTTAGGGAIGNYATLILTNSNLLSNHANLCSGGAIHNAGTLNITGSNLQDNTATEAGGAINNFQGILNIQNSNLLLNTASWGGALMNYLGTVTINGTHITNNTAIDAGAIYQNGGSILMNYCRIYANTPNAICRESGIFDAEYNWWGSNDPQFASLIKSASFAPNAWLFMTINATPSTINNGETSTITVSFNNYSSDGTSYTPFNPLVGHLPDQTLVVFNTDLGSVGSKTVERNTITGAAQATLTSDETPGTAHLSALTDDETVYTDVTIKSTEPPRSSLYLTVTPGKTNPVTGETVTYTLKVGNNGPDPAENVVMTYTLPEGMEFVGASDDVGNTWTYDPNTRTITWTLGTVPVGDPTLLLNLRFLRGGEFLINPLLATTTYDPTLNQETQSLTVNAQAAPLVNPTGTTVEAKSITQGTVAMQTTGTPLAGIALAILMLMGGMVSARRK